MKRSWIAFGVIAVLAGNPLRAQGPLRVTVTMVGAITKGHPVPVTWTVTGTTAPVRLRLRNQSPRVVELEGGNNQMVMTSGGASNAVSRSVTGKKAGDIDITVDILDSPEMSAFFQRELTRIAAELENASGKLTVEHETIRADELLALFDKTETDVKNSLPNLEFAAFRDYVAALFAAARRKVDEQTIRNQQIADRPSVARIPEVIARAFIASLVDILRRNANASPLGTICVTTIPENGASVSLYPGSLPSEKQAVTSASRLTLYLGRYAYEITRSGYLDSKGFVDLLINPDRIVQCPLRRAEADSQACRLLEGSPDKCR